MHIITRKRIHEFCDAYPAIRGALEHWFRLMKKSRFRDIVDLRKVFPHADIVGRLVVFNIGGNKVRLVAAIHFNRGKIYIRHILTHSDYDKGAWKQ